MISQHCKSSVEVPWKWSDLNHFTHGVKSTHVDFCVSLFWIVKQDHAFKRMQNTSSRVCLFNDLIYFYKLFVRVRLCNKATAHIGQERSIHQSLEGQLKIKYVEIWQKTTKFCKAIILQLKKKLIKKLYRQKCVHWYTWFITWILLEKSLKLLH